MMGPPSHQSLIAPCRSIAPARAMRASKRPYMRLAVAQATYCTNTYRQGTRDTAAIHAIALGQVLQRAMSCHRRLMLARRAWRRHRCPPFHLSTLEQEVTLPHPR